MWERWGFSRLLLETNIVDEITVSTLDVDQSDSEAASAFVPFLLVCYADV